METLGRKRSDELLQHGVACSLPATPRTSFPRPVRKGLNLAASDVPVLARALKAYYERDRTEWLVSFESAGL